MREPFCAYDCPHCGQELKGELGEPVYCTNCNVTFETDWDYDDPERTPGETFWLTGTEYKGKPRN